MSLPRSGHFSSKPFSASTPYPQPPRTGVSKSKGKGSFNASTQYRFLRRGNSEASKKKSLDAMARGTHLHAWIAHSLGCKTKTKAAKVCRCSFDAKLPLEGYPEILEWLQRWMESMAFEEWYVFEFPLEDGKVKARVDLLVKCGDRIHIVEFKTGSKAATRRSASAGFYGRGLIANHKRQVSLCALLYQDQQPHKMPVAMAHVVYLDQLTVQSYDPEAWETYRSYLATPATPATPATSAKTG